MSVIPVRQGTEGHFPGPFNQPAVRGHGHDYFPFVFAFEQLLLKGSGEESYEVLTPRV